MGDSQEQESIRDIIVIGASAGGVEALTYLVKHLPLNLNAAVVLVLHLPSQSPSIMPDILARAAKLPVFEAQDGKAIMGGQIYVAPPDYHLLLKPGHLHLTKAATENGYRPAIDPLFRTAARAYGQRVVGVVLTGLLDDGTAGLMAIKMRGGVAVVQDPDDAVYSSMPLSAIENVEDIDHILPLSEIPSTLVVLANTPVEAEQEKPVASDMEFELEKAQLNMEAVEDTAQNAEPSTFSCPDCGGTLWEIQEEKLLRFRCRIGHAYSAETLLAKQSDALEDALWIALRALQEKATLSHRMASRMRDRNLTLAAQKLEQEAQSAQERSKIVQEALEMSNGKSQGNKTPIPVQQELTTE
ncbi:chemotaxis protein CheB [Nostocaceae cyanobacterium CENA369]|uniref:protein-glutamate methylesterase n=1 Tax=Dendronalium phyllosphericum CENA369 TaxID=1725256 RepID=A0A8J7LEH1_9NOST|nr:chemotaxis protein CheB [Dendronalium phyllosphericum]MBH8574166.1 chemotaxis protein CheB [Dendronalium phyllosphericum CENA369]